MADEATSPLLGASNHRPSSRRSARSTSSGRSRKSGAPSESTPLLSQQDQDNPPSYSGSLANGAPSPATTSLRSLQNRSKGKSKGGIRKARIISLFVLTITAILILCLGFAAPTIVEEYTKQAIVFEPTNLSIHSFTTSGVKARVQGDFLLDASRVEQKPIRDLGKAGTWIAREIESVPSDVKVYLPEYGNVLLGTAKVPGIKINIRNQHVNHVDFLTDLEPGDVDSVRRIANDWLDGRLTRLRVMGVASVALKSGIFKLPAQKRSESLLFEGQNLPAFPSFDISKLNFHEVALPDDQRAMAADASVALMNKYPVRFDVPPLGFEILVPNCSPSEEYLLLANASTKVIKVRPKHVVNVDVSGIVRQLPDALTSACPGSKTSPLDTLIAKYLDGQDTTIYVRGADAPSSDTPAWVTDLIRSVTVPLPLPGHPFGNLIRNFSLADVHFSLPAPWAEEGSPESKPRISALVKVLAALPKEMNFPLDVNQVRADADIFYQGKKLGRLDLHEWQNANATEVDDEYAGSALLVQSEVDKAPLDIQDEDLFSKLVQRLLFGSERITLTVKASVDVQTVTALGEFVVREIPAEGNVFVKPISGGRGFSGLKPKIFDLEILNTTSESIALQAKINMTNPTIYSASIPHARINIAVNDTILGHATVKNLDVVPGNNTNLVAEAVWNPREAGDKQGGEVGRNLLSQYLSGFNTTLTLKTDESTIPSQPSIGRALSFLEILIDTPKLGGPEDDGNEEHTGPHFIKDATMHLLSSTATFTLLSPLPKTTLFITSVDATAYYNHTELIGTIEYSYPFAVPPGASTTPKLPVDWTLGGAGYDAVRDALGGELKLDASADVGIRIDQWEETVWYTGKGIGARKGMDLYRAKIGHASKKRATELEKLDVGLVA